MRRAPARFVPGHGDALGEPLAAIEAHSDSDNDDTDDAVKVSEGREPSEDTESDSCPPTPEGRRSGTQSGVKKVPSRTAMSRKKRRQARKSVSKKPKKPRREATSTAGQQGDAALALQAAAVSQGNQDLQQAAIVAVTGAVLPASFPASNFISYALLWSSERWSA